MTSTPSRTNSVAISPGAIAAPSGIPEVDRDITAFRVAELLQTPPEGVGEWVRRRGGYQHADERQFSRLLRARRERPRRCCAADERDERAPLHSITSSARAASVAGTSIPSVLAVCRLMTNSNLLA